MRAGPLSDSKVISLLNSYFVPVYTVNEDYSSKGSAPAEEKAERKRIFQQGHEAKLSVGTVHVYLLAPDGRLVDTMHVAKAAKSQSLITMLEKTVGILKTVSGQPVVPPAPQSCLPPSEKNSLVLHLVARSLDGRGAWSDFPVENWIVLSQAEQQRLAPGGEMHAGRFLDPGQRRFRQTVDAFLSGHGEQRRVQESSRRAITQSHRPHYKQWQGAGAHRWQSQDATQLLSQGRWQTRGSDGGRLIGF